MSGSAVEYVEIKLTFERAFRGKSLLVKLVYIAIMTHILQARVETHVVARVVTHVLARVIMHVHDYYLKTCGEGSPRCIIGQTRIFKEIQNRVIVSEEE